MTFLRMEDLDLVNKRVLIRQDLNVPLSAGKVANETRIVAALPTIELAKASAKQVIIMSHLGRPKEGVPIDEQEEFSMLPIAEHLCNLLKTPVSLITNYLDNSQ